MTCPIILYLSTKTVNFPNPVNPEGSMASGVSAWALTFRNVSKEILPKFRGCSHIIWQANITRCAGKVTPKLKWHSMVRVHHNKIPKKLICLKCISSHFKPFEIMFLHLLRRRGTPKQHEAVILVPTVLMKEEQKSYVIWVQPLSICISTFI